MNLFSESILCIIFYNLLNSHLQIDSYSDAQKASCDEQNCNFFVDVIYLKLLTWKKIPLERGNDKRIIVVNWHKHLEFPNKHEV